MEPTNTTNVIKASGAKAVWRKAFNELNVMDD